MKLKLPDGVASPQDLSSLIQETRDYAKWYVHESIKKRVNVKHVSQPPTLSPSAMEIIHDWTTQKTLTEASLEELIKTLEDYNKTSPTASITLAAPPTSAIKKVLVGWCRENLAPNIMVTFGFNATLLGGLVVRYGSHTYDWSFRRQILSAKDQFPEVLRHV